MKPIRVSGDKDPRRFAEQLNRAFDLVLRLVERRTRTFADAPEAQESTKNSNVLARITDVDERVNTAKEETTALIKRVSAQRVSVSGTDTSGPTNAPSGLAVGSVWPLPEFDLTDAPTLKARVYNRLIELEWAYTNGAVPADGFELVITVEDALTNEYEQRILLGADARSHFAVMVTGVIDVSVRAFRLVDGGLAFSSADTLSTSYPAISAEYEVATAAQGALADSASQPGHTHVESDITDLDHDAVKLQGRAVFDAAPNDGDVLTWDNGNARWAPEAPSVGGGSSWTEDANTSINASDGDWLLLTVGSSATVTLPATAAKGATVRVMGDGSTPIQVDANTGQTIKDEFNETTSGGSINARQDFGAVELVCVVANTEWRVATSRGVWEFN